MRSKPNISDVILRERWPSNNAGSTKKAQPEVIELKATGREPSENAMSSKKRRGISTIPLKRKKNSINAMGAKQTEEIRRNSQGKMAQQ